MKKLFKKYRLLILILLSMSLCFGKTIFKTGDNVFAAGVHQITFDDGFGNTSQQNTNADGKLDTIPTASNANYIFQYWSYNSAPVNLDTEFSQDSTVYAYWATKTHHYQVSFVGSTFVIYGETNVNALTYLVTDSHSSLTDALAEINNDVSSASQAITIEFDNISANENLTFTSQNLTLSGQLNLNSNNITFNSVNSNSNLTLDNFEITSNADNQIVVIGTNVSAITISNATFNTTNSNNCYALKFETTNFTFNIQNKLVYSTTYLFNHKIGITTNIASNINLNDQVGGKIAFTIPYQADEKTIINNVGSLSGYSFLVYPDQDFFETLSPMFNISSIYGRTSFEITFDANGGTIDEGYETLTAHYGNTQHLQFLTNDHISKTHCSLGGFIAKVTFDSTIVSANSLPTNTWYFDATALQNFINNGSNFADIPTYFYQSIPTNNVTPFTYYAFDNSSTDLNFLATDFILSQSQAPTFVAYWTKASYTISFETNDGTAVSNITAPFESEVVLPTTTKTGFDFAGWYYDENYESSAAELNSMPDTNPTLYAKWQPANYILNIHKNNGSDTVSINVPYQTNITNISDVSETTKTGYSFVAWYTDELLENELEDFTMPHQEFSIFAKWQVNSYSIQLYLNHPSDSSLFDEITADYATDITEFVEQTPSFEGYIFIGWYKDTSGQTTYNLKTQTTMPAENLILYGIWSPINYDLKFYYNNIVLWSRSDMHFEEEIAYPADPNITGYRFIGWYADEDFEELFTLTTMPSHSISVYAKMQAKTTIVLNNTQQSYNISSNPSYQIKSNIGNFVIEYYVNNEWTIKEPTQMGSYDVRISRNEDEYYNQYSYIIEKGLVITANAMDIAIPIAILYILAIIEIAFAIVIAMFRLRKKSFINIASVALPFAVISDSQFINLVISAILFIFGLILLITEIVKFHKLNNLIAKKITEEDPEPAKRPDNSENISISLKVEELLKKEKLISDDETKTDE